MRTPSITPVYIIIAVIVAGLGTWMWQASKSRNDSASHMIAVKVPSLSPLAARGKVAFDANCAACHGVNAAGTDKGPPLIHDIYNPGHHGDGAFFLAAKQGVRRHHWPYGDMPAQPQVTEAQVVNIVHYVRELQQANGIGYRPHQM